LETALLSVIVVLLAGFALTAALMARAVRDLKRTLGHLDKQVEGLKADLARQEESLAQVRSVLAKRPEDPFMNLFDSVERFRSKGALATALMIGTRIFRAYLSRRPRRKALLQIPRPEQKT
jgi:hypothetical protein